MGKWQFVPGIHYNYNAQDSTIKFYNGTEFHLVDLDYLPSDPMYDRLGSVEYTGAFIEEAQEIESKAKEVVKSRIRYKLGEFGLIPKLLMTCNPSKNYLYYEFYKPAKQNRLPVHLAFIQSLVTDNPHVDPSYIEALRKLKDKILKMRLLLGIWEYEDSDLNLFSYDAICDLFTNTVEKGDKYISCDVARFGSDQAVIMLWEGLRVMEIKTFPKSATTEIETYVKLLAANHHVPMSRVVVDEDGVGGGVVDHLKCKGFVGNASPIDNKRPSDMKKVEYKLNYQNLRTQCYHKLAEMTNEAKIAIPIDDIKVRDMIIEELEQIKAADVDKTGKFKITPKEEIKEILGRSPDYSDTLMMRMLFEVKPEPAKARVFSQSPL